MPKTKNNIYTPSYFMKRMKDNGFGTWKMFDKYGPHDSRYWTMILDPGGYSVWVTCYLNRDELKDVCFELNDGGVNIPRNFILKTDSIQTFINTLLTFNVQNTQIFDSSLIDVNSINGEQQRASTTEKTQAEVHQETN
jgi:hypothetical protein